MKTRIARLTAAAVGLLVLSLGSIQAQVVDRDELNRSDLAAVQFLNYVGPHRVVNTRAQIQGIGTQLGEGARQTEAFRLGDRYEVRRVFDPTARDRLSADVLVLLPSAGVDHIRNLNWIVGAYLEAQFGYGSAESALVADFVTRYNAVLRGNWAYFQQRFVPGLAGAVTNTAQVGLSTRFDEWPGRTFLVIPLRSSLSAGPRGSVNVEEVGRGEVARTLTTPEGLARQTDLTNLRETEIAREQETIRRAEEELNRREQALTNSGRDQVQAEQERQAIALERQRVEEARQEVQAREEALAEDREELAERTQAAQETPGSAASASDPTQTPAPSAQTDSPGTGAGSSSGTTPAAAPAQSAPDPVVVALPVDPLGVFFRLRRVDARAQRTMNTSELNSIRNGRFEPFGGSLLVLAGREGLNTAVRFLLLDPNTFETRGQGTVDIHPNGAWTVSGTTVLAPFQDNGQWFLGRFGADLALQARSDQPVAGPGQVTVKGAQLVTGGPDGSVLFLNAQTLKVEARVGN